MKNIILTLLISFFAVFALFSEVQAANGSNSGYIYSAYDQDVTEYPERKENLFDNIKNTFNDDADAAQVAEAADADFDSVIERIQYNKSIVEDIREKMEDLDAAEATPKALEVVESKSEMKDSLSSEVSEAVDSMVDDVVLDTEEEFMAAEEIFDNGKPTQRALVEDEVVYNTDHREFVDVNEYQESAVQHHHDSSKSMEFVDDKGNHIEIKGQFDSIEVTEDYWKQAVADQTIENVAKNLKIDEAFEEAMNIQLPVSTSHKMEDEKDLDLTTPKETILGAIEPEFRNKKIDLNFDETSLSDVILSVGDAAQMNIVLDPMLKNKTMDLHLNQVPVEDILLLMASTYDLGFKLIGNSLFIAEREKIKNQNVASKLIKVRNINVLEAKALVEDLIETVNVSEEISSLVVVGEPGQIVKVQDVLAKIDVPQPQVILEAKIIELNKDALKDLGVDWSDQVTLSYQESHRPTDFDESENSSRNPFEISQLQRNPLQFNTTIRMLENQNKAKILSNPRISTLNNKEAEIFVGDEVPYTITNISGGVVTNDVRFVEPGIRLRITPSIIEDDFVVMKVQPEVSFIVAFRGPNDEFPQVRTREAVAFVRVKNDQPFVLGGILNQEDKSSLFKVPVLGNIPLLGNLFSYNKDTVVDTELVITIIPTIVRGSM